ncbi:hypothetical protein C8N43_3099 [Litoreibacter ponti]|uniref:Uncharacterized protein n=1 Tax=Litoreibacter ponti TaxID=1510457 RepID=A0A2T6BE04_9RHOB|nr:hypothetical protein [Litoreibacter ponti]PTX54286.1 hypothetical protein C8N43_3099 [Litoreibacter ponti]
MKTVLWIIGGVLLAGGLAVVWLGWVLSGAPSLMPAPAKTPAPEGFVASDYPPITELSAPEGVRLIDLSAFGEYFEHYFLPDERVTYFRVFAGDEMSTTVFVDAQGRLMGQIKLLPNDFPMGPHFVDPDGSHTVTATEVGPYVPHVLLDGEATQARLQELHAQATRYRRFSYTDMPRDRPEFDAKLATHVFEIDGVWHKIVEDGATSLDWKGAPFEQLDVQYDISRSLDPADATRFMDGAYTLRLTHFDQQTYLGKKGAPMGSTTGVGRGAQWRGDGFYTLVAGDAELRFSLVGDTEFLSNPSRTYLTMSGKPDLDMVVLRHQVYGRPTAAYVVARD